MRDKKHILIVSQYFYPENFRINDIAKEWVKRGYKVTVLTGIPNYPQGKFFDGYGLFKRRRDIFDGVDIIRIPLVPRGNGKIMLALNYVSFVISGYIWRVLTKLKPDYVFIYEVSPMIQALPAVSFAKKRKIPCYTYVTDLWPESVEVVLGLKNKFILKYLNKMVDSIYSGSTKILTSSRSFIDKIGARDSLYADKLMFWPQYAEDFYEIVEYRNKDVYDKHFKGNDSFKIIFAGNIGKSQNLGLLVKVAQQLKESNILNLKFYIVGDGRYRERLVSEVSENNLQDYFKFIDRQPADKIRYFMFESDAALISLSKSEIFSMTIPAKTQSCLACGIPILVSADGEIQDIIKEAEAGLCSDANDVVGLYNNIVEISSYDKTELEAIKQNAVDYSQKKFNKNKLMEIIDNELFN